MSTVARGGDEQAYPGPTHPNWTPIRQGQESEVAHIAGVLGSTTCLPHFEYREFNKIACWASGWAVAGVCIGCDRSALPPHVLSLRRPLPALPRVQHPTRLPKTGTPHLLLRCVEDSSTSNEWASHIPHANWEVLGCVEMHCAGVRMGCGTGSTGAGTFRMGDFPSLAQAWRSQLGGPYLRWRLGAGGCWAMLLQSGGGGYTTPSPQPALGALYALSQGPRPMWAWAATGTLQCTHRWVVCVPCGGTTSAGPRGPWRCAPFTALPNGLAAAHLHATSLEALDPCAGGEARGWGHKPRCDAEVPGAPPGDLHVLQHFAPVPLPQPVRRGIAGVLEQRPAERVGGGGGRGGGGTPPPTANTQGGRGRTWTGPGFGAAHGQSGSCGLWAQSPGKAISRIRAQSGGGQ